MGLFNWFNPQPKNNDVIQTTHVGSASPFPSLFGLSPNNEDTVTKIPTANFCIEQIVKPISQLPVYLYKQNGDSIERITDNRLKNRERVLNDEANVFHKGSNLKSHMLRQCLLYGSSYASVQWIGGKTRLESLIPLDAKRVIVQRHLKDGHIPTSATVVFDTTSTDENVITTGKQQKVEFQHYDCVIVADNDTDGLTGVGVIKKGELVFSLARAILEHQHDYNARGGVPFGYLTVDAELGGERGKKVIDDVLAQWDANYSKNGTRGFTPVFGKGIEFHELTKPDVSFDKKVEVIDKQIMSVFGVPYSKLNGVASKEEESAFRKNTLSPWIGKLEEAFNYTLLTESEKEQGFFFRFDTSELERASEEERTNSIGQAYERGLLNSHQVAEKLDLPKQGKPLYKGHSGQPFLELQDDGTFKVLNGNNTTEKEIVESSA